MGQIIIGVDPHKLSATIEVVDEREQLLGSGRFSTDRAGYTAMVTHAKSWPDRVWAVEGANGTGRPLAQRLLEAGEHVVDVPAKLAARVRLFDTGHNRKTDTRDAHSIAVVAVRTTTCLLATRTGRRFAGRSTRGPPGIRRLGRGAWGGRHVNCRSDGGLAVWRAKVIEVLRLCPSGSRPPSLGPCCRSPTSNGRTANGPLVGSCHLGHRRFLYRCLPVAVATADKSDPVASQRGFSGCGWWNKGAGRAFGALGAVHLNILLVTAAVLGVDAPAMTPE